MTGPELYRLSDYAGESADADAPRVKVTQPFTHPGWWQATVTYRGEVRDDGWAQDEGAAWQVGRAIGSQMVQQHEKAEGRP